MFRASSMPRCAVPSNVRPTRSSAWPSPRFRWLDLGHGHPGASSTGPGGRRSRPGAGSSHRNPDPPGGRRRARADRVLPLEPDGRHPLSPRARAGRRRVRTGPAGAGCRQPVRTVDRPAGLPPQPPPAGHPRPGGGPRALPADPDVRAALRAVPSPQRTRLDVPGPGAPRGSAARSPHLGRGHRRCGSPASARDGADAAGGRGSRGRVRPSEAAGPNDRPSSGGRPAQRPLVKLTCGGRRSGPS